jgi:hypothetical protein
MLHCEREALRKPLTRFGQQGVSFVEATGAAECPGGTEPTSFVLRRGLSEFGIEAYRLLPVLGPFGAGCGGG